MSIDDVFRALLRQWDDLLSRLTDEDADRLRAVIADLVTGWANPGEMPDPHDVLVDLLPLLAPVLRPSDPLWQALQSPRGRTEGATADLDVEAEFRAIVAQLGERLASAPDDAPHSPDAVWRRATRRLLAEPHLVEWSDPPPEPDGLVRLDRPDGRRQVPRFQLDEDLRPLALVVRVNQLLDADDDPWGVADWWLSPHAVLGVAPAALLGSDREGDIWEAARALGGHRA